MGAGRPDDAAIPAVLGYHAPVRLSRDIVARLNRFAHGLHLLLLTGSVPPAAACAGRAAGMPAARPAPDGARACMTMRPVATTGWPWRRTSA